MAGVATQMAGIATQMAPAGASAAYSDSLAYSDELNEIPAGDPEPFYEDESRKPFLLVGSALTSIFVVGVVALVISLAVSIRPTVDQRPNPGETPVIPSQAAPAPVPELAPAKPAPAPAPASTAAGDHQGTRAGRSAGSRAGAEDRVRAAARARTCGARPGPSAGGTAARAHTCRTGPRARGAGDPACVVAADLQPARVLPAAAAGVGPAVA